MRDLSQETILLYSEEYDRLMRRRKRLHLHDWEYRIGTLEGKLGILSEREHIEYGQFPSGRFCSKCHCIEFVSPDVVRAHGGMFWTQRDLTYLLEPID